MNNILLKLASVVRNELEEITKNDIYCLSTEPFDLKPFPNGCCKLSSLILGLFMKNDFELIGVEYVWGMNKDEGSHGWIEYKSIIYDITIDQFEVGLQTHPILVINKSLSDFHNLFQSQKRFDVILNESNNGYKVYTNIKEKVLSKI